MLRTKNDHSCWWMVQIFKVIWNVATYEPFERSFWIWKIWKQPCHTQELGSTEVGFQQARILFQQLGLSSWEKRPHIQLLAKSEQLVREIKNLDNQKGGWYLWWISKAIVYLTLDLFFLPGLESNALHIEIQTLMHSTLRILHTASHYTYREICTNTHTNTNIHRSTHIHVQHMYQNDLPTTPTH